MDDPMEGVVAGAGASKGKVLHMVHNPSANAQQAMIDGLKARVQALRMQLDVAEAGAAASAASTDTGGGGGGGGGGGKEASLAAGLAEAQGECEELKKQVKDLSTQKERLKTVFQSKIKEFRDKVQTLTGYRVDLPNAPPFNLYNLYPPYKPPTAQNVLTFRDNKEEGGGMELLGTQFTERLAAEMATYLEQNDSIPAFLSAVALGIFDNRL